MENIRRQECEKKIFKREELPKKIHSKKIIWVIRQKV